MLFVYTFIRLFEWLNAEWEFSIKILTFYYSRVKGVGDDQKIYEYSLFSFARTRKQKKYKLHTSWVKDKCMLNLFWILKFEWEVGK